MIARPCLVCGEVTDQSRCPEHRPKDLRRHRGRGHTNDDPRMRRLSRRLRRDSPFCEWCGSTTDLTVDHIVPKSEVPALTYNVANLRVLCRDCNSRRGTNVTDDERNAVYAAVEARRERLTATRAVAPSDTADPPDGKPHQALLTRVKSGSEGSESADGKAKKYCDPETEAVCHECCRKRRSEDADGGDADATFLSVGAVFGGVVSDDESDTVDDEEQANQYLSDYHGVILP